VQTPSSPPPGDISSVAAGGDRLLDRTGRMLAGIFTDLAA